jgi:hypothetical protein
MGGLGSIKSYILNQILSYSMCITIAIFSYIDPTKFLFRYESYIFLIILIIGICSSVFALISIQNLLKYRKGKSIEIINQLYEENYKKMNKIILREQYMADKSALDTISSIMNDINFEKDIIMSMQTNVIDIKALLQ